jgi:hypothetical protein
MYQQHFSSNESEFNYIRRDSQVKLPFKEMAQKRARESENSIEERKQEPPRIQVMNQNEPPRL